MATSSIAICTRTAGRTHEHGHEAEDRARPLARAGLRDRSRPRDRRLRRRRRAPARVASRTGARGGCGSRPCSPPGAPFRWRALLAVRVRDHARARRVAPTRARARDGRLHIDVRLLVLAGRRGRGAVRGMTRRRRHGARRACLRGRALEAVQGAFRRRGQSAGGRAARCDGWGPTAKVGSVARAWAELARLMHECGAATVGDLDPAEVAGRAEKLWVVPPGGSLL